MVRFHKIAAAALLAAGVAGAHAADFFAGASFGGSKFHTEDVPGVNIDSTDTGFKLYGGVSFTPNFSLEAGYVDLGKLKASAGGVTGSQSADGFYLDAVGEFPLNGGFSLLGKLGVFRAESKANIPGFLSDKDTGTDIKFGIGGSYAINKNLSVRAEVERYRLNVFDDKGDVDLYSIGLSYKF
ncbi:outer membrane beta-barrel protein [Ideonella sp. BN130291]|uniref:outer membrane beta-barrel protein n=1 Tax=Ideonella sp. BN130291 TaxID=3112940 RepID=UPI002E27652F|nr:outer membrane beta-barrel protein [Ideonella sp. BN130291]